MGNQWPRRRWLEFRFGHSMYLIFAISFANFILIFHRLLIERVDFLNEVFASLWVFAVVFIIGYIPIAILVGHWHKTTQIKVETETFYRESPYLARWWRVLYEMQTGKASKEEIEEMLKIFKSIESGKSITKIDKK